jgi:two-component system cell cycle sensor histidine kinase/response regulator CckA
MCLPASDNRWRDETAVTAQFAVARTGQIGVGLKDRALRSSPLNSREAMPVRASGDPASAEHGGPIAPHSARLPTVEAKPQDVSRELRLLQQTEHLASVGGWEFDFKTRALFWTDETYRIHETSPAELTPDIDSALAFFLPDSRELLDRAIRTADQEGEPWDLELEITTARGRTIDVRVTGVVQVENGIAVRAFGAVQDITARKRLEHRLLAAGKMESIGRMAGGLAHDFNNWITAILSYSEVALRTTAQSSPEHEAVLRIRQAAEHATSLTRQLISLARPRPSTTAVIDINELIQSALPLLTGSIDRSISFGVQLCEGPLYARVNASQLRQVVMNLILNARDAMPGGGRIDISTRAGEAGEAGMGACKGTGVGKEDAGDVLLILTDTGEGMTRETLDHLFEPFFTTKPGGKGTGLGLATCYSIIKAIGGDIHVSSTPGCGSTFTIMLPRAAVPAAAV